MDKNKVERSSKENERRYSLDKKQPSLPTLIMWNISKALEKNPNIDLRCAMRSAYERLAQESRDVNAMISRYPEERNIACAVLAWQQLGHKDTESLYEFIESHRNRSPSITSEKSVKTNNICSANTSDLPKRQKGFIDHKPSTYSDGVDSASFDTRSLIGPVLKLPVETKVIMRVENTSPCARHSPKKSTKCPKSDTTNKIDAACCLDSACAERLKELEASTAEMRSRASKLARREAERVELLERAEAAWRDLELGYQRRLQLAEEKEDDLSKQIKKCIEDRNAYKTACTNLAQELRKRGEIVEKDRADLAKIEKEVCDLACTRLRLSEESAKNDAAIADQQCKAVQLERDLQFKEEQARRKLLSIESAMDSSRGLTLESERATREELSTIKEQIAQVSNQLLEQDAENNQIKVELDELRQQKTEMFEDLEGCKQLCDSRMQGKIDELNKKRQMLQELKDKVMECQCKLPQNMAVEVKRTPSLAALCQCTPEEKILHCCSCTSVRTTLLSNLLADLFSGLQAELGDTGSLMPCQLLKCLEDKHNWDRESIVKSNLRSYFSKLLLGELDTAIATSIEKYHATWVGASCADKAKLTPEPDEEVVEGWQERALESRAQKLASKLAEQLFEERADELIQRAKDIVTSGPPPCECQPQSNKAATYTCLIKTPTIGGSSRKNDACPTYLKRTLQDVTLLRTEIEDLKKETLKKEDLRNMEKKITKIVKQASDPGHLPVTTNNINNEDGIHKQKIANRSVNTEEIKEINASKCTRKNNITNAGVIKRQNKKLVDTNGRIVDSQLPGRPVRKMGQSYAVNLCLCDGKKNIESASRNHTYSDDLNAWKEKLSQSIPPTPSMKQSKPISRIYSKDRNSSKIKNKAFKNLCPRDCNCFHKLPSNTSIDKLLETLLKWKGDLSNCPTFNVSSAPKASDYIKEIHHNSELSNNKMSENISQSLKNIKKQNISKDHIVTITETNQGPPISTSEYIGDIHLDKSNESICKCNINYANGKSNKQEGSNLNANLLFKCLNKSNCNCKKYIANDGKNNKADDLNSVPVTVNEKKYFDLESGIKSFNGENNIVVNELDEYQYFMGETAHVNQNNQTTETNFLSSDQDFFVKFLGVTLTDVNARRSKIVGSQNKQEIIQNTNISINHNQSNNYCRLTPLDKQNKETRNSESISEEANFNRNQSFELRNDSNEHFVECDHKNNERREDTYLLDGLRNIKSCVCCNDDETQNLEVNTFYLLEKHLKHKLAGLRNSSCNSSCILPAEEKKVFSTILEKIKQVISDCTYQVKCECSLENKNSGNWIRVNSLLEEYLKMKINRVKCTCVPSKDSLKTVLPHVLKQVSNLIENDFDRLKNLYRYKNSNNNIEWEHFLSKDQDIQVKENFKNADKCHKCSNNSYIHMGLANVSIQGSQNLGIEDKSCDAIELKDTKDVQTSHSRLSVNLNNTNEVIITHCYNLHKELPIQTATEHVLTELKTEVVKEQPSHINQKMTSQYDIPIPYVGCTLNCSYNNFSSCICSKSLSQVHINNIDRIWKMLEINRKLLPNLSYIMHSIPKRARSENVIDFVEVTEPSYVPFVSETISDNNTKYVSADDNEDIVLKDSIDKLKHSDINDNMTNTLDDLLSVTTECLNDDDTLYWYDCCQSPRYVKNELMHKKSFYKSVYLPLDKLSKRAKSDISVKNNVKMCTSRSKHCDCVMVPVCHVKMLVENIENKLLNSQCTCDSFSSQICPVHSKIEG